MPAYKHELPEDEIQNDKSKSSDSNSPFKGPRHSALNASDVDSQINETKLRLKEKEEIVRKLKLVRMYRTKWETQDLHSVTDQWLRVSQEALENLRTKLKDNMEQENGQQLTLLSLIQSLGLDSQLLQLDETEDCFISQ